MLDTIPTPKPEKDVTNRHVRVMRGEYAGRLGVVKEWKSSMWQVEVDLGDKKTVIEGYLIEELMLLEDEAMPQRIEAQNVGKDVIVLTGKFSGLTGTIKGFEDGKYIVKIGVISVPLAPTAISIKTVATTENHVGSLTSAGVAGELAKTSTPEPLSELEQLRSEVARLNGDNEKLGAKINEMINEKTALEFSAKKTDELYRDLETARQTAAAHQAANTVLNQEKFALEKERDKFKNRAFDLSLALVDLVQVVGLNPDADVIGAIPLAIEQLKRTKPHPADIEAMRQVEKQRDDALHDLRVANEQSAIFARELNKLRRRVNRQQQPVVFKTLVQELTEDMTGESTVNKDADEALETWVNTGWKVFNISVTTASDIANHAIAITRVVTLSRPVKPQPESPKREAVAEEPAPAHKQYAVGMPVVPGAVPATAPLNSIPTIITPTGEERPVTFEEALRLHNAGKLSMDEVLQIGNQRVIGAARAAMQKHQPYRPLSTRFQLRTGVTHVGR